MIEKINSIISDVIEESGLKIHRKPLVKVSGVDNPYLRRLKEIVHPDHFLPEEILPGAKSVVAYFLPFDKQIVQGNRGGRNASKQWAQTYIETNRLLDRIADRISAQFIQEGYLCTGEKPTHNFNTSTLLSCWSHKHVAFACGLGRFGKNRLLITEQGCAGRIGSVVTNWESVQTELNNERNPFYDCPENCTYCINACPVGALTQETLDKGACYEMCLENDRLYPDLELCDVCGKCSTGPCSLMG